MCRALAGVPGNICRIGTRKFFRCDSTALTTACERVKGRQLRTSLCTGNRDAPLVSVFRRTSRTDVPASRSASAGYNAVPTSLGTTSAVFSRKLCSGGGVLIRIASGALRVKVGGSADATK